MYDTPKEMQDALDAIVFRDGHCNSFYYNKKYSEIPSLGRYVYNLVGGQFILFACGPMLRQIAKHFRENGNEVYAKYFDSVWKEEWWHFRLMLHDVKNLGFDFNKLSLELGDTYVATKMFHSRFVSYLDRNDPLGFLVPAYLFERITEFIKEDYVSGIEAKYGNGRTTRSVTAFLEIHSDCGPETKHVEDSLVFMSSLSDSEKEKLFVELEYYCKLMWSGEFEDQYPGDERMADILQKCKL